ncbi:MULTISPECIES: hypothetical protein [unclassified Bradyrhizobium]|uniref:hypothetical protein n=1 Tax=unclassified Bradyrhizobium TaxID=2631580 RepID=UPI001FF931E4|nr:MULTISPECIES: hypothetical protein [unclassified Bradyrhizobium]
MNSFIGISRPNVTVQLSVGATVSTVVAAHAPVAIVAANRHRDIFLHARTPRSPCAPEGEKTGKCSEHGTSPLAAQLKNQELLMSLKRRVENLGPYQSLFLLAVPTATVEPLKLVAVAVAGEGHWIAGTAMIATCYLLSLFVVERLFVIVKPKLLTIPWFAKLWTAILAVRTWFVAAFRRMRARMS